MQVLLSGAVVFTCDRPVGPLPRSTPFFRPETSHRAARVCSEYRVRHEADHSCIATLSVSPYQHPVCVYRAPPGRVPEAPSASSRPLTPSKCTRTSARRPSPWKLCVCTPDERRYSIAERASEALPTLTSRYAEGLTAPIRRRPADVDASTATCPLRTTSSAKLPTQCGLPCFGFVCVS